MWSWIGDLLSLAGLALTLSGAAITARAVILSEDDAIKIGVSRFGSDDRETALALPMVQNLLASSRGARRGLLTIAAGTAVQMIPIICRLVGLS